MKLFSALPLYVAILCVSVQSTLATLATLKSIERILGGPCPARWTRFGSYCYFVSSSIKTWDQAQASCKGLGGELVKINSAEENEFVLNLVKKSAPSLNQVWIGLKWNPSVKDFLWSDLSVPLYKNWAPKEPNGNGGEPCCNMWISHRGSVGYWNDLPCGVTPHSPCGTVCKRLP